MLSRTLRVLGLPIAMLVLANAAVAQVSYGNADKDGVVVPRFPALEGTASIENSGEATINVPIPVPPGVRGRAPRISLGYSASAREGGLGRGWSLSLGYPDAVRRSTAHGVPRYDDRDIFTYGSQDLVRIGANTAASLRRITLTLNIPTPTPTNVEYRTRVDSFNIIRHRSDGSFVVLEKDGTVLEYGSTLAARSYIPGKGTYAWHLSAIRDSFGNTVELKYELGDPEAGEARQLTSVRYTIRQSQAVGPEANVSLHWEPRNDVRRSSAYGGEVVLKHRLDRIETHSGPNVVRSFDLCYADEGCSGVVDAPPGRPWLLMSVTESGSDGTSLPPRKFSYQKHTPSWAPTNDFGMDLLFGTIYIDTNQGLSKGLSVDQGVRILDVNGDGHPDLIFSNHYTSALLKERQQPGEGFPLPRTVP